VSEKVVGEGNFQGESVRTVMRSTSVDIHRRILFELIHVTQGKKIRATPVHQAFEQGRVHIVGHQPGLEWQLTHWVPPEAGEDAGDPGDPPEGQEDGEESSDWSPDRLDAMVFGVTDLILGKSSGTGKIEVADGRIPRTNGLRPDHGPLTPRAGVVPIAKTRQGQLTEQQLRRPKSEDGNGR
jgi:hypothetical protein